jgi:hypothetical protein
MLIIHGHTIIPIRVGMSDFTIEGNSSNNDMPDRTAFRPLAGPKLANCLQHNVEF